MKSLLFWNSNFSSLWRVTQSPYIFIYMIINFSLIHICMLCENSKLVAPHATWSLLSSAVVLSVSSVLSPKLHQPFFGFTPNFFLIACSEQLVQDNWNLSGLFKKRSPRVTRPLGTSQKRPCVVAATPAGASESIVNNNNLGGKNIEQFNERGRRSLNWIGN